MASNQNPERIARDTIDVQLVAACWAVQNKDAVASHVGEGQAAWEYATATGSADYAAAKLCDIQSTGHPLPILDEATNIVTRVTDQRVPKPCSREVFSFHRPSSPHLALFAHKLVKRPAQIDQHEYQHYFAA